MCFVHVCETLHPRSRFRVYLEKKRNIIHYWVFNDLRQKKRNITCNIRHKARNIRQGLTNTANDVRLIPA